MSWAVAVVQPTESESMQNATGRQWKKLVGKVMPIVIALIIGGFFVVPRVMHQFGHPSSEILSKVEAIKGRIGVETFGNFMKAISPAGYAALCAKEHGENPELMAAAKAYNDRYLAKMEALVQSLKAGGLTADEKDALDKYAYSMVSGDIRNGHVSCQDAAARINRGEWDF